MKIKPTSKYILVSKEKEDDNERLLLGLNSSFRKDSTEIEVEVLLDFYKESKDDKKEIQYKKGTKLIVVAGDLKEIKKKNFESVFLIEPSYILAEIDAEDGFLLKENNKEVEEYGLS